MFHLEVVSIHLCNGTYLSRHIDPQIDRTVSRSPLNIYWTPWKPVISLAITTLRLTNMEVENPGFVEENGLPFGAMPSMLVAGSVSTHDEHHGIWTWPVLRTSPRSFRSFL